MDIAHWIYLFGALAAGGFLSKVWDTLFHKRVRQLDEADILSRLSSALREEIRTENRGLRKDIQTMKDAMVHLTDVLDELFPSITGLTDDQRNLLRQAANQAKLAT